MNQIKITWNTLKDIAMDMNKNLSHNHISNISLVNSTDLIFAFSNYRKEKLFVSLNHQSPFLSLIETNDSVPTRLGKLNDILRKEVKDGYTEKIETLGNDRVLEISYFFTNEYYEREKRFLIFELIPHRPNLIILNNGRQVLFAIHYTSLDNPHQIVQNLHYELLENNYTQSDKEKFNLKEYKALCLEAFYHAKHKRLEEQFKPLFTHIKSRIKTLQQKLKVLDREIIVANNNLSNKEIGEMLLAYSYNKDALNDYIKENNITYDQLLSAGVNADKYFKKYKKAKRTIEMDSLEINKTKDEINYLEVTLAQASYMNEDDILELGELLFPKKFKIGKKNKIESKPSCIAMKDGKIYYGKNAKQNDYLTFKLANKTDYFFHIKDYHGAHVIVQANKLTNELILIASEIALLLSGKEVGDTQYTEIKNIKKGSSLGQAILTSYSVITLTNVRESTKNLLLNK